MILFLSKKMLILNCLYILFHNIVLKLTTKVDFTAISCDQYYKCFDLICYLILKIMLLYNEYNLKI